MRVESPHSSQTPNISGTASQAARGCRFFAKRHAANTSRGANTKLGTIFTANAAPVFGQTQVGLFKPPYGESINISAQVTGNGPIEPECDDDTNGDNVVNVLDLYFIIALLRASG